MTQTFSTLADYGWTPYFQSQLDLDEVATTRPARVMAVHRGALEIACPDFSGRVPPPGDDERDRVTVGDWLLIDAASRQPVRLLTRSSLFRRKAAGAGRETQLIAANVDTLFVVTSCNQDFNLARLERYLAVAREADVTPVVVLTKADLTDDVARYAAQAADLLAGLIVEAVDARVSDAAMRLRDWCGPGQTVALVGSSGVGKSTLVNTLAATAQQATAGIREDDAKGRHTTSARSLHPLPTGGWLVDTPGMRELALADAESGLADVFAEIVALAADCRFADCRHESEPACAVQQAITEGRLDPARLKRWRKLAAEETHNSETIAQSRARYRAFGKRVKGAMRAKQARYED